MTERVGEAKAFPSPEKSLSRRRDPDSGARVQTAAVHGPRLRPDTSAIAERSPLHGDDGFALV